MSDPIEGRAVCDERAHLCHCVKLPGHVDAGDAVHGCDERECSGQWTGTFETADFRIQRMPGPVVVGIEATR